MSAPRDTNVTYPQNPEMIGSIFDIVRMDAATDNQTLSAWVRSMQEQSAVDTLFELETWLRGLVAFLDPEHVPLADAEKADILRRSYVSEIAIIEEVIEICENRASELLAKTLFDTAAVATLLQSHSRKTHQISDSGAISRSVGPREDLCRLMDVLNDHRVLIQNLREDSARDVGLFLSLGRSFRSSLKGCRHVEALLRQRFRVEYDSVENPKIAAVLRRIEDAKTRRKTAIALLFLNRMLRYLNVIGEELRRDHVLRRCVPLFSLLYHEITTLTDFLKSSFLRGNNARSDLRRTAELMTYSLQSEGSRALERELLSVSREPEAHRIFSKVETAHGLLTNVCESCVIMLLQLFDPDFDCASVFPSRLEHVLAGQKLREDLWNLREFFKKSLEPGADLNSAGILQRLESFRRISTGNLMFRDWEEFDRFSGDVIGAESPAALGRHVRQFIQYLEFLVQEVSKRSFFREAGTEDVVES